jgi:hypothetical protein
MKRVKVTGKKAPRLHHTGHQEPLVDPQMVAKALGADIESCRRVVQAYVPDRSVIAVVGRGLDLLKRDSALRQRLAELEERDALLKGWVEHAKKRHDLATVRCLEDWLSGDGPDPLI